MLQKPVVCMMEAFWGNQFRICGGFLLNCASSGINGTPLYSGNVGTTAGLWNENTNTEAAAIGESFVASSNYCGNIAGERETEETVSEDAKLRTGNWRKREI